MRFGLILAGLAPSPLEAPSRLLLHVISGGHPRLMAAQISFSYRRCRRELDSRCLFSLLPLLLSALFLEFSV